MIDRLSNLCKADPDMDYPVSRVDGRSVGSAGVSFYGTLVIVSHSLVVAWHLMVLSYLHGFSLREAIVLSVLANAIPLLALMLLWTRFVRVGGLILLISLGPALVFGGGSHFLSNGSDNVFRILAGEWTFQYQTSSILLFFLELFGFWVGIAALRNRPHSIKEGIA